MRDTIDMAREVGSQEYGPLTRNWSFELTQLKAFEALVRADESKEMQAEHEADKVIIEYHEATIKRLEAELKARGNT